MPNFRDLITESIQSTPNSAVPDLPLAEAENRYHIAVARLQDVQKALAESESSYARQSRYLKKLLHDKVAAKLEVPRLKKELFKLKERLISLTFETEKWGKECRKQEQKIVTLLEKKSTITHSLSTIENKRQSLDAANDQLTKESAALLANIKSSTAIRSKINVFNHIVPAQQPSAWSKDHSSTELVDDLNNVVSKIHTTQTAKEQGDARIVALNTSISNRQKSVETTEQRVKKLREECAKKNDIVTSLDNQISGLKNQVEKLQQHYQTYNEIIEEGRSVTNERTTLITIVNQENSALKDALLTCNKLEMTLRLEELKLAVFLKETKKLNE